MKPTQAHKDWFNYLRSQLGGKTSVTMYDDNERTTSIRIFASENEGGVVGATIGLMEVDQSRQPGIEVRTEILVDCRHYSDGALNLLSTIAFYVMKNGWRVRPGVVFEDIVAMYFPDTALPHVYFTSPAQWEGMSEVALSTGMIYPLIAIPISAAEADLASLNDGDDLESWWEANNIDVLDWNRTGAI